MILHITDMATYNIDTYMCSLRIGLLIRLVICIYIKDITPVFLSGKILCVVNCARGLCIRACEGLCFDPKECLYSFDRLDRC